jgi:rhodanese-related sulfurtransferase
LSKFVTILGISGALAVYAAWLPAAHRAPPPIGPAGKEIPLVRFDRVKELWQEPSTLFLDVRPKSDFIFGHVPGAVNLPDNEFETYFPPLKERLQRAQVLVVYCKSTDCAASLWAAIRLRNEGLTQTVIYPEGWNDWFTRGMPVARDVER